MTTHNVGFEQIIQEDQFIALIEKTEKLKLVSFLAQLPLPVAIFDRESRFIGLNQSFADIYESDALYLNGKLLKSVSTHVYHQFLDVIPIFEDGENQADFEFYAKGHFYLSYYKALRSNNDGELLAIVVVCADITRLKRKENVLLLNNKKLHDHLFLDAVTGLPNKMAFDQFINESENQTVLEQKLSFLKVDLDEFKKFNQVNSYTFGDEVLAKIAEVLTEEISQDNARQFRMNSANFIVVVFNATPWTVLTLAERIKCSIAQLNIRFTNTNEEFLTASIGIVHKEPQMIVPLDQLFQQLDIAVRQAKLQGHNSIYTLN